MTDFYEAQRKDFEGVHRSFTFAGVTLHLKAVFPADVTADIAMLAENRYEDNLYDLIVSVVRRSLRPEDRPRWDDLLAAERDVPITFGMLNELLTALINEESALVEERTGRPTQQPEPSGNTGRTTSTPSTENSGSPVAPASTVST